MSLEQFVPYQLCSTTLIDNVCCDLCIANDGRVLLAGTDTSAVSRDRTINYMIVNFHLLRRPIGMRRPWKPTLAGEPASPWAARITPWACASDSIAALYRIDESIFEKEGVQHGKNE